MSDNGLELDSKISEKNSFSALPYYLVLVFVSTSVIVLLVSIFLLDFPRFFKKIPKIGYVPPINVLDVRFQSGFIKDNFLTNFRRAEETDDFNERYELLRDNFSMLRGFYTVSHDPTLRQQAELYAQYMAKNYPDKYEQEKAFYTIPCMDTTCGEPNYPDKINEIKSQIGIDDAFDNRVKESIFKRFEEAALSNDRNSQWTTYVNSLCMIKAEYERTKNDMIKSVYTNLKDFLISTYPEWKLPDYALLQ